ncbi:MAG: C45 family peptidase [Eubacteriales bacterium]|nr:C45 family peptidase [Eubacteriales bacterium]
MEMKRKRLKEVYVKAADPFERGRQHGSQVKEEIARVCAGYGKSFEKKGYTWEEACSMAMEYVPFLEQEMPELMAEAKGIAAGAEVDLAVVMVLNTRYELLKFKKGVNAYENAECTCYALTPEATKEKETIGGQNWDNAPFIGENLYVIHIDEENGTKIAGLCEPAQMLRNGMNNHGLSLNCSTLLSKKDVRGIAVPTNFMRRRLMQCRTLGEAEEILRSFRPCVSLNYVLASAKDQDCVVYETTPVENFVLKPSQGVLTQGNDIQADPTLDRFVPADRDHQHHFRGQRLGYLLRKCAGEITPEYIQECLRDHYGAPASVCNHAGDQNLQTIASMLYFVSRGYALIAWGNPCETAYERYDL